MCILQIGELANGLSQEFRDTTKERIQWKSIRGMRNWIAHAYNEMEDEVVWATVKTAIPQLHTFCDECIANEP